MKTIVKYTLALLIGICSMSQVEAIEPPAPATDTIIINIDNTSKIIIMVESKEDLEKLKTYDINAMIRDITESVDTSENEDYVKIEDESGDRYANDSTRNENERYQKAETAEINIGNYKIEIDEDEDFDFDSRNEVRKTVETGRRMNKKTQHEFNVEIGLNNYLQDDKFPDGSEDYSVKPWGSWFVGLSSIHSTQVGNGPLFLEWGGTLNWYNFKLENTDVQILDTDNGTEYVLSDPAISGSKSKLTASYINVSLVPIIDFSRGERKVTKFDSPNVSISKYQKRGLRIGVGGYAGYRLGSHTKFKFKENGNSDKDKSHGNFNLNNFRYGVRGQIGFKGVDMFINYDLNDLFNDNKGPASLQAVSFGFIL